MRKISFASSPCSREEMSRLSLKDLLRVSRLFRNLSRRNPERTSALTKVGLDALQRRCEELHLQPRGTRGESGGQTGHTYDISNKHRLGYSEVELVQKMIDGVNTLWKEDQAFQGGAAAPAAPAAASKPAGDGKYQAMPAQVNLPFPNIQSKHSLVAKHVTKDVWEKLKGIKTKTSGFTLIQAIACAV